MADDKENSQEENTEDCSVYSSGASVLDPSTSSTVVAPAKGMALSLTEAARSGDVQRVRELLSRGTNVLTIRDHDGKSPVHHAAGQGHYECLRLLLASQAEPRDRDNYGNSPLIEAAGGGHAQCISILLERGADVDAKNNVHGLTALHVAAQIGSIDAIVALLDRGADIHASDNKGNTPLHTAARHGWTDATRCLLQRGADPNLPDENGRTPLHHVATNGDDQSLDVLLQPGVGQYETNVNAQDSNGYTALQIAAIYGKRGRDKCIRQLLDAGADVNIRDRDGRTALDCVHAEDIREILRSAGADAEAKRAYQESQRAVYDAIDSRTATVNYSFQPLPRSFSPREGANPAHTSPAHPSAPAGPSNASNGPVTLQQIHDRLSSVERAVQGMQRQIDQLQSGHTMVSQDHHGHLRNLAEAVNYLYAQIGIYPEDALDGDGDDGHGDDDIARAKAHAHAHAQHQQQQQQQQHPGADPLIQAAQAHGQINSTRPAQGPQARQPTERFQGQSNTVIPTEVPTRSRSGIPSSGEASYGRLPNGQLVLLQQQQQPPAPQQQQQQAQVSSSTAGRTGLANTAYHSTARAPPGLVRIPAQPTHLLHQQLGQHGQQGGQTVYRTPPPHGHNIPPPHMPPF